MSRSRISKSKAFRIVCLLAVSTLLTAPTQAQPSPPDRRFGAAEIIDPRPYAVGSIRDTFEKYPGTGAVLPAMGYGSEQRKDLEATIANTPADLVLVGTPIDLRRVINIRQPSQRVRYELQEVGQPTLVEILQDRFASQ